MVVTTVLIIMDITMVRDRLRMRLPPLDQTLTLTLMAGVSYFNGSVTLSLHPT